MFKNKNLLALLFLTLVGGLIRFIFLNRFPVSLNWDEVSHGYNAYSILLTGRDEWGRVFPAIFRAFGDYKLPLYIYLTTIPVWLFGLNAFAIRFISALAGTLAIPGIYFLTRELFPGRQILLGSRKPKAINFEFISALVLAFLPWHIFISRPALEANLALTLIIFGFYFLLRFFHNKSSLIPSVILLGLSMHAYNTARVFTPLMVIAALFLFKSSLRGVLATKQSIQFKNILAIVLALIFSGLVISQVYMGEGIARYEKLKILSPAAVFQIGESLKNSTLPYPVAKLIHNRPVFFISTFAKNYVGYFTPSFFMQTWGAQFQFAIPGENLLTLPVFLLAFLGFFAYLIRIRQDKYFAFLYLWFLLSPVAAALTIDPPQALRPNPMIPAVIIFSCFGLSQLLIIVPDKLKHILTYALLLWMLVSFCFYLNNYFSVYSQKYSSSWQYGYEQIMYFVKNHKTEYDRVFITKRYGEPHIFYAFFNKLDPKILQPGGDNIRFEKSDWFWTDKIENVYFINDWQIPVTSIKSLPLESGGEIPVQRSLLITSPDHVPVNAHVIDTINFLDGSPAYIITSVP